MELKSVAQYFDRTHMWDAYNGKKLKARCQVTVWDAPRRDGLTTIRRTMSMAYGSQLPPRHAIVFGGEAWIVSRMQSPDTFGLDTVRVGYVIQQAQLGKIGKTDDVLSNQGYDVFLSRVWVKDIKDIVNASEMQSQVAIYFTENEPVEQSQFLFVDGHWHIVRNIVVGTAGLMIAECNELEADCVVEVDFVSSGEWNPVTETYENGVVFRLPAILLDWRDDYIHEQASAQTEQVGDIRMRFSSMHAGSIKQDSRIEFRGDTWQVVSIQTRNDGSLSVAFRRVA